MLHCAIASIANPNNCLASSNCILRSSIDADRSGRLKNDRIAATRANDDLFLDHNQFDGILTATSCFSHWLESPHLDVFSMSPSNVR
mmetsp:Transcript_16448/g.31194  ORF Transcript_16448/g.31194 Transcript_16448/m.31194 type:complete len:87 (+) Transcript_16448:39-299(+)